MASKRSTTRKSAAIGLAIVGIAGLSLAAAAQLNASSSTLGATTTVVAPCQTAPITATYTTGYTSTAPVGYKVTSVVLTGLTDCVGKAVKVSLLDTGDNLIGTELTATGAATTTLAVAPSVVPASAVAKLAVVISG
ncbi:hypothetical protein [Cellulomonas humilata]|uniref:Uncharacterized protein n=1 Tax=Cellulomonas humilata TaxID=144055 RepID=A0ABU0EA67_9CELL|nr:hypothetical protein [Cellulomonas humilata]MDQ0372154.1 hypothetical protein [Cellulomonas humilata]